MPMPSRNVRPAGNRHSCGDASLTPRAGSAGYMQPGMRGAVARRSRTVVPGGRLRSKRQVRCEFSPAAGARNAWMGVPPGRRGGMSTGRVQVRFGTGDIAFQRQQRACRRYRPRRASWGESGHSRAVRRGRPVARAVIAPARVCMRPRRATPGERGRGDGPTPFDSSSPLRRDGRTALGMSACRLAVPYWSRTRRWFDLGLRRRHDRHSCA
jgi:hypothetical protein